MLDDLERTPEDAAPRSVDVLVRRSLEWLGPERQARFELLAIYPPGAAITQPMLEDLWETSQNADPKGDKAPGPGRPCPAGTEGPAHDRAARPHHRLAASRLAAAPTMPATNRPPAPGRALPASRRQPRRAHGDRAEWLAYHLVAAGAWDRLKALPTLRWRSAFLVATGSDAAFLAGLDHYGHAALARAPDAVYHAVRAWLFAAHVRALIGRLPVPLLVAMALVGDPIAAITQACQHPEAGEAVPAVLAAVADRLDTRLLLERALALAGAIPDDWERSRGAGRYRRVGWPPPTPGTRR